jgi:hypothetical protein
MYEEISSTANLSCTRFLNDGLIKNNTGNLLMNNLKDDGQGYIGTFNIGVNTTHGDVDKIDSTANCSYT